MTRVLIVEDEEAMAVALKDGFEYEGYEVVQAGDGQAALALAGSEAPDLILLDVMLPKLSGLDVCRELRAKGVQVPIIMLTARGQEIDKVLGLKLGADDYMTKPFSFMELTARVEAVLRRTRGDPAGGQARYRFGDVLVDFDRAELTRAGEPVEVSARELRLLRYFLEHQGEAIDRDTLLEAVWDHNTPQLTRTVDVHVAKLRKKIEDRPSEPRFLLTVHRVGYKFVGPAQPA